MDNNLSYADFAAMTGNNNGVNSMWNNPLNQIKWFVPLRKKLYICSVNKEYNYGKLENY